MGDQPLGNADIAEAGGKAAGAEANRGIGFPRIYDLLMRILTRGREQQYREELLDLAGVAPGHCVLDIGCGTGTQAIATHRRAQPGRVGHRYRRLREHAHYRTPQGPPRRR